MRLNITSIEEPTRVSPSRIGVYRDCPKKFDFIYRQGLKRKETKQYFDLGNYIHELLHVYYQNLGAAPNVDKDFLSATIQARIRNDLKSANKANIDIYNRARKVVTAFIAKQSPKIDRGIRVEQVEYEFDIPVILPSGRKVNLYGFIDLLYRTIRGVLVVRDHKSTSGFVRFTQSQTEADSQLLFYGAVIYLLTGEVPVVEFNILNTYEYKGTPPPDSEFKLLVAHHNDKVYENFLAETLRLIDEMLDSKPTPHYSRECSSCAFWDLCRMELKGSSIVRIKEANYERRDPNELRRTISFTQDNSPAD